jgi:GT2 family glycosyltransferase
MVSSPTLPPSIVVAIPVKNEAERIASCLSALASQLNSPRFKVLLLLNNCSDDTAKIVSSCAERLPLEIHLHELELAPSHANAGCARSLAMEIAAELAGSGGILMTTDADGRAGRNWVAGNLAWLRRGCDAVAGRAEIDPVEAALIPSILHEDDAREAAYAAILDEITALLDPDSYDPWPRHNEHSGASIAVTVECFRRAGGMPAMSLGEDRSFFDELRRIDARIRHAPEVRVVVSGRIEGRATGGMADTIRRRLHQPDTMLDDRLEPAINATRRAWLRRQMRLAWHAARETGDIQLGALSGALNLNPSELVDLLRLQYFGAAWSTMETITPTLLRQRVPVAELASQTCRATKIPRMLHSQYRVNSAAVDPNDTAARAFG